MVRKCGTGKLQPKEHKTYRGSGNGLHNHGYIGFDSQINLIQEPFFFFFIFASFAFSFSFFVFPISKRTGDEKSCTLHFINSR